MQKDHNEFMRLKAWLFNHQVPIWGEGVAECLFFSLIAWAMWKNAWGERPEGSVNYSLKNGMTHHINF